MTPIFKMPCLGASGYLLALSLLGCASTPPTGVHQPMTARPAYQAASSAENGSIFQGNTARYLFEDKRARYVGDILTVNIVESNKASADSASKAARSGGVSASVSGVAAYPFNRIKPIANMDGLDASMKSENTFSGSGNTANNNAFNGVITVTVIEVYPNGNLLVSGEKQVSIGHQQEFIRLSGVVNPRDIRSETSSVDSSRIADARIEYKTTGYISEAQVMGWLARFFLSVMPF